MKPSKSKLQIKKDRKIPNSSTIDLTENKINNFRIGIYCLLLDTGVHKYLTVK